MDSGPKKPFAKAVGASRHKDLTPKQAKALPTPIQAPAPSRHAASDQALPTPIQAPAPSRHAASDQALPTPIQAPAPSRHAAWDLDPCLVRFSKPPGLATPPRPFRMPLPLPAGTGSSSAVAEELPQHRPQSEHLLPIGLIQDNQSLFNFDPATTFTGGYQANRLYGFSRPQQHNERLPVKIAMPHTAVNKAANESKEVKKEISRAVRTTAPEACSSDATKCVDHVRPEVMPEDIGMTSVIMDEKTVLILQPTSCMPKFRLLRLGSDIAELCHMLLIDEEKVKRSMKDDAENGVRVLQVGTCRAIAISDNERIREYLALLCLAVSTIVVHDFNLRCVGSPPFFKTLQSLVERAKQKLGTEESC